MIKENKMHLALVSGLFAAGGGVFGKFAGFYAIADYWQLVAKVMLWLAMVMSNTLGQTLYTKALAGSGSSLPATVANSTVNYVCSALLGLLLFGETTSGRWWCGTGLVLLGLLLICHSPRNDGTTAAAAARKRQ